MLLIRQYFAMDRLQQQRPARHYSLLYTLGSGHPRDLSVRAKFLLRYRANHIICTVLPWLYPLYTRR